MDVLGRVIKESRDALKEIAGDEPAQTLIELVHLQRCEIEYLRPFCDLVREISERFPSRWQELEYANAVATVNQAASAVLPPERPPRPDQKYEAKRRHQFADNGVGLIEFQFGGELERIWRADPLPWPLRSQFLALGPTCLDDIFAGVAVKMERLEQLFWMHRNRFGKLPVITRGRETFYDYHAVLIIIDRLLSEDPSAQQTVGRRLHLWLDKPDIRQRVLVGIETKLNNFPMPEHIRAEFRGLLNSYLQHSAKK